MIITSAVDVSIHAVSPVSIPDVPPTKKAPRHKRGDVERLRFASGMVATFGGPMTKELAAPPTRRRRLAAGIAGAGLNVLVLVTAAMLPSALSNLSFLVG